MQHTRKEQMEAFGRFLDILDELRVKCPWDKKQTNESLRPNTIEETYELCDALMRDDKQDICKELGDVLLHVAFYAKIGSETGDFDIKDVCDRLCEKLIFRHPHVFGDVKAETAGQVSENWEQLKLKEKDGNKSVLSGVPAALPSLIKAYRIQDKARNVGFDWEKKEDVWDKVREELGELQAELAQEDKEKSTDEFGDFLFSVINAGKILFDFYEKTGDGRYKVAMDTLRKQLTEQPRTSEGGFWHKLIYPHQMWLDGIFMASPYLAQYGNVFKDTTVNADIVNQIKLIARKTYDPKTGLFYHGWDESKTQNWANKETGCSPNFWSRSIGWYAAAVVDILDYMPAQFEGRDSIMTIINTLAEGIVKYQEPETGVWWQVTDQNNRKGNYLESSASSLFVYFLCKAVNKGYIPVEYKAAAERGFNGLIKQFIKEEPDGSYTITNCCAVAGLGGKGNRDGSFAYYIGEPVIENDPKSVGSFILAAIEYEKMKQ